jgi:hypothetical protein
MGRDSTRQFRQLIPLPQMLIRDEPQEMWSPQFLVICFSPSTPTAFSPTDTAVLSRWAKVGMMVQSIISLTIVAF